MILKLNGQGKLEWEKRYGGAPANAARSIKQTDDGGYVAAGTKWYKKTTKTDMWVIRLDNIGEMVWEQTSGGKGQNEAIAIDLAEDGGFVMAGSAYLKESGAVKIVKLGPNGEILWIRVYDTKGNDGAFDLRRTKNGGFIVTGETFVGNLNKADVLVLKLDSEGLLIP